MFYKIIEWELHSIQPVLRHKKIKRGTMQTAVVDIIFCYDSLWLKPNIVWTKGGYEPSSGKWWNKKIPFLEKVVGCRKWTVYTMAWLFWKMSEWKYCYGTIQQNVELHEWKWHIIDMSQFCLLPISFFKKSQVVESWLFEVNV